jgi:hypothetical protein
VIRALRNGLRFASDLTAYGRRTGRWWVGCLIIVVIAAALLATVTAEVVVPIAVYTLT